MTRIVPIVVLIISERMKRDTFTIKCHDQLILSSSLFFVNLLLFRLITSDEYVPRLFHFVSCSQRKKIPRVPVISLFFLPASIPSEIKTINPGTAAGWNIRRWRRWMKYVGVARPMTKFNGRISYFFFPFLTDKTFWNIDTILNILR